MKELGQPDISLNNEQKRVPVRTVRKLLKQFPRYDQEIFMNVIVGDESWIHYFRPHQNISNRVWLTKNARRPCIATRITIAKNVMFTIFFHYQGTSNTGPYTKRQMHVRFYKKKALRKLIEFYRRHQSKTGICGIYQLHDNT